MIVYDVVRGDTLEVLIGAMNVRLEEGWVLAGGVAVSMEPAARSHLTAGGSGVPPQMRTVYLQAVTKDLG